MRNNVELTRMPKRSGTTMNEALVFGVRMMQLGRLNCVSFARCKMIVLKFAAVVLGPA